MFWMQMGIRTGLVAAEVMGGGSSDLGRAGTQQPNVE
ncbi:hypothetical protein FHT72_005867 [Rhizobium sp. BK077]|nr:hypothetical protein [Rhizobium sp. BK112]MBB3371340.1 hypothetical protein [Rhizobium sp. BK077]MBB4182172.1 hypothetical protein [Rhizobium sp. BK109]MBB4255601.1 hypothetical protein [Rhizobium sp. BK008]